MTLRELRTMIHSTNGLKTPGPKALRESESPVVAADVRNGDGIIVYENGFATYQRDGKITVMSADDIGDYSYYFATGESVISQEFFLDQDYTIFLSLVGEDRLTHNMNTCSELHEISYSDQETEWGAMKDDSQDILGKILRQELLREVYGCMTERQTEIVNMYYLEQLTSREIAERLGISHQGVKKNLELAKENVQRKIKKF